jgi:hypothetical protein
VTLKLEVKNSQGQAVPDATIKVNNTELGKTNGLGKATIETIVPVQSSNRLEIVKDSRSYYYAPFYDSFVAQNEQPSTITIKATLYFVPKPDTAGEEKKTEVQPVSVVTTTATDEAAVAPAVVEPPKQPPAEVAEDQTTPNAENEEKLSNSVVPVLEVAQEAKSNKPLEAKAPELTIFTVHAYSAGQPLGDVTVYVGDEAKGSLKDGCVTNTRGRCVLKFPSEEVGARRVVVSKPGYITSSQSAELTNGGKIRFELKRGFAVDLFAMASRYQYQSGIRGAEVFIKGQKVGVTDAFGHLTHTFAGKKDDLVDIVIKAPGYLPLEYEADFVLSEPISIVRFFAPAEPRTARIAIMKAQPAGKLEQDEISSFSGALDQSIVASVNNHMFRVPAFEAVPKERFQEIAQASKLSLSEMLRKGWQQTEVKGEIDALIVPTIVVGASKTLELSVVDSRGKTIAAAKETLDHLSDVSAIDHAVAKIAEKLRRSFPFEGAISGKDGEVQFLNFGSSIGIDVRKGDQFVVMGTQIGEYGRTQDFVEIGTLEVINADASTTTAKVLNLAPRAVIRIGDAVVFKGGGAAGLEQKSTAFLKIVADERGQQTPVAQANVYLNEQWLGASDAGGKLYLDKKATSERGMLRVVKPGYSDFNRELTFEGRRSVEIKLEKSQVLLTIDSEPTQAHVFVDGKLVGVTPLMTPTAIPTGFVRLEVKGPEGYKTYAKVLDLQEGVIDYTGGKRIILEKDFQTAIATLSRSGKYQEAVEKLKSVPKEHSDYLNSQHQIGELYLTRLGEPALAASAFANVTTDPIVKNFVDKRFIGSHINEGVALFETAERLQGQDAELAAMHYQKAAEVLTRVSAQLRFVPEDQYQKALQSVGYHQALALHKLWYQSKQPEYLNQAFKSWRAYLESADQKDLSATPMIENAKVFMKQAEADLNKLGSVR